RKPCRRPRTVVQGSCVSIASLEPAERLRYLPGGAGGNPGLQRSRPRRDDRRAGAARLDAAPRLAAGARAARRRRSQRDALELDVGVAEQLVERLPLVVVLVEDAADTGVDQHLEAMDARGVGDVDVGVPDAGAVPRRLRDRVDLGVNASEAVL